MAEHIAAIARVRAFIKARSDFYARRPSRTRAYPNYIHAEYGRLDMRDIETIIDAAEAAHSGGGKDA